MIFVTLAYMLNVFTVNFHFYSEKYSFLSQNVRHRLYIGHRPTQGVYVFYTATPGKKIRSLPGSSLLEEPALHNRSLCKSWIHRGSISLRHTPTDKWQTSINNMDKHMLHTHVTSHGASAPYFTWAKGQQMPSASFRPKG